MQKSKMWSEFIFFVLIIIVEAESSLPDNDRIKINFKIQTDQRNIPTCDHSDDKKQENKYTVLEGRIFTIVTKYERVINHVICNAYTDENIRFNHLPIIYKYSGFNFMGEKRMGTVWKCMILTNRDNPIMKPVVRYKDSNYAAAYCFMKIHVRQKEPPQTILVNNMIVPAVRENQVEKDVDFTAEYQYADKDNVNVACFNALNRTPLTMEYEMAGTKSDNNTMRDLSSSKLIGFVTKLHSGHNNSYMICTSLQTTDYTKVMIRFVMKTILSIVSVTINGLILRPILTDSQKHLYEVDYKFFNYQHINVTCEIDQTDVKLFVSHDFDKSASTQTELISNKKTEFRFYLTPGKAKLLICSANYVTGLLKESVYIKFTPPNFPVGIVSVTINGLILRPIFTVSPNHHYEFEYKFVNHQYVNVTCEIDQTDVKLSVFHDFDKSASTQTELISNKKTEFRFYLTPGNDKLLNCSAYYVTGVLKESVYIKFTAPNFPVGKTSKGSGYSTLVYSMSAFGIIIILVVLSYICIKKQCCVRPSAPILALIIDPASVFYENLLSVFQPINDREAAELENHYEEIH